MVRVEPVHVIGGGLAGSEAAWQLATRGVPVILHEMRPVRTTDAHHTESLAELRLLRTCSVLLRMEPACRMPWASCIGKCARPAG